MNLTNREHCDLTASLCRRLAVLEYVSIFSDCTVLFAMKHGHLQGTCYRLELWHLEVSHLIPHIANHHICGGYAYKYQLTIDIIVIEGF